MTTTDTGLAGDQGIILRKWQSWWVSRILEPVAKAIDQNVYQSKVSVGAMDELEQILSEGRLPSPPVWTPEGVVKVFNWTLTRGRLTRICGRVVTVDLSPNWKPFSHKFNYDGMAFVLRGVVGPLSQSMYDTSASDC